PGGFSLAPCLLLPFPGTVGRYREAFPHLAVFLLGVYCTVEHGPAGCAMLAGCSGGRWQRLCPAGYWPPPRPSGPHRTGGDPTTGNHSRREGPHVANPLQRLADFGQSFWLDNLSRVLI